MSIDNIINDFNNIKKNYVKDPYEDDIKVGNKILNLAKDTSLTEKDIQNIIVKNKEYYVFLSKFPLIVNMILSTKDFDIEIFKKHVDNKEENPIDKAIYYAVEYVKKNKQLFGNINIKKFRRDMYNDIKKAQEELKNMKKFNYNNI